MKTQLLTWLDSVDFAACKPLTYQGVAEACGSRTHHSGREGQNQWL
jgi:hypothetical protein